jgi:hypothetical protein
LFSQKKSRTKKIIPGCRQPIVFLYNSKNKTNPEKRIKNNITLRAKKGKFADTRFIFNKKTIPVGNLNSKT